MSNFFSVLVSLFATLMIVSVYLLAYQLFIEKRDLWSIQVELRFIYEAYRTNARYVFVSYKRINNKLDKNVALIDTFQEKYRYKNWDRFYYFLEAENEERSIVDPYSIFSPKDYEDYLDAIALSAELNKAHDFKNCSW